MTEKKRLIGRDGKVYQAQKGAVITGNGTTVLTKGEFYIPVAIGSTTGFPNGVQVGYPFVGDGASIPTSGDKYLALTLKSQCDITSAEVEFEKDEIDITTLCDDIRKYASGFSDATGTLEGITTLDLSEPMIAKFVTVQKQDNLGAITTIAQNDDPLVVVIELNKIDNSDADRALFFAPVTLNGYTLGVNIDDAQTFSSGFRIAQDNDIKPILVEADKALFTTGSST